MKKFFIAVSLSMMVGAASAQDIIFKRDGTEIEAKVTEVGTSTVKYKRFSNLDGPAYEMAKSDIFMIKYQNGEKDLFQNEIAAQPQVPAQTTQNVQAAAPASAANPAALVSAVQSGDTNEMMRTAISFAKTVDYKKLKYGVGLSGSAELFTSPGSDSRLFWGPGVKGYANYMLAEDSDWLVGAAVGFRYLMASSEQDFGKTKETLSLLAVDIYTGMDKPRGRRGGSRGLLFGARLRVPLSYSMDIAGYSTNGSAYLSSLQYGIFGGIEHNLGRRFLVGYDIEYIFTRLMESARSMSFGFNMTFAYRF